MPKALTPYLRPYTWIFFFCISFGAQADENFLVQVPAVYEPGAPVPIHIRLECGIEQMIGKYVFEELSARAPTVGQIKDIEAAGNAKVLRLTLVNVSGLGGGGWSGPKNIVVRADVAQKGEVIQTMTFQRNSRGGVFGNLRGTCSIMDRIASVLGKEIAIWAPVESQSK